MNPSFVSVSVMFGGSDKSEVGIRKYYKKASVILFFSYCQQIYDQKEMNNVTCVTCGEISSYDLLSQITEL